MGGAEPVNMNTYSGNNGQLNGYNFSMGDPSHPLNMTNPGTMDPMSLNPYAGHDLQGMQNAASDFGNMSSQYLDPSKNNAMRDYYGQRATTGASNYMARMGMSGSSAEAGQVMQAGMNNDMYWQQHGLDQSLKAAQGQSMLDSNAMRGTMGIQGQYGGFQNQLLDTFMGLKGAQNQQTASDNQLLGSIIGGGLQGGGTAAGMAMMPVAASDERLKTDISSGDKDVEEFLDHLEPKTYKYKNPSIDGEGEHTSVMAQDLEKSSIGSKLIVETERGKMVDYAKALPAILAAQANLHKRLKELEKL